jgi:uncharacterized flavoprotein (TIGR03862 family)
MPSAAPIKKIAIIGGGPAGLMAAQYASGHGIEVHVYERKASVGRKFLIAGRGGMNLTHAEAMAPFCARYGTEQNTVAEWLREFDNQAIRDWAKDLGIDTFVGSSGRVFPTDLKAAPLLRAWLRKLRESGVQFHVKQQCLEFIDAHTLRMLGPDGEYTLRADAVILALGGASWPQLGSDGAWVPWLEKAGVRIAELQAANCGFNVEWTEHFKDRFAGHALKPLRIALDGDSGKGLQGECVISDYGIEGSLIYALSRRIRETIRSEGQSTIHLDLLPDHDLPRLRRLLERPRNGRSLSDTLRRWFGLSAVKTGLIYELTDRTRLGDPVYLADALKRLPLQLQSPRPITEAISTAGGVTLTQLDDALMLKAHPGVFIAGEMLDWEAPTGGYLLTASMASGRLAGVGALAYLIGSTPNKAV